MCFHFCNIFYTCNEGCYPHILAFLALCLIFILWNFLWNMVRKMYRYNMHGYSALAFHLTNKTIAFLFVFILSKLQWAFPGSAEHILITSARRTGFFSSSWNELLLTDLSEFVFQYRSTYLKEAPPLSLKSWAITNCYTSDVLKLGSIEFQLSVRQIPTVTLRTRHKNWYVVAK